jgi:23S rRNA pseudouridine2457 synthase
MAEVVNPVTLVFNKPFGVLSCFTDAQGRSTLADFISVPHVYSAGRLDEDSEGLLVLTSDGTLAHRLTDPRHKVSKTYLVQVERIPEHKDLVRLQKGVIVQGRRTLPAKVELIESEPKLWPRPVPIRFRKSVPTAWLKITIQEGRNRQVRRMTAAIGFPTLRIIRVEIGPLKLKGLDPGQWRVLTKKECTTLKGELGLLSSRGQSPLRNT